MSRELGHEIGRRITNGGGLLNLVFVHLAQNEAFDDTTLTEHTNAFAEWQSGVGYAASGIARYDGALWRCLQSHSSQSGWEPGVAASLWKQIGDPGEEWPEWSQPIGSTDAYQAGDKVRFGGKHWVSVAADNVWQPGVYGWETSYEKSRG